MLKKWGLSEVPAGAAAVIGSCDDTPLSEALADLSSGFSGADIANVGRLAASLAMREPGANIQPSTGRISHEAGEATSLCFRVTPSHALAAVESMRLRIQ
jgi:SpoVK/Ycf46/Vps4 family AAA+-type ATPase